MSNIKLYSDFNEKPGVFRIPVAHLTNRVYYDDILHMPGVLPTGQRAYQDGDEIEVVRLDASGAAHITET
jgi:hypothetical protein